MPNWCNNIVTLRHKDPAMIERVIKGIEDNSLFHEFIPMPQQLAETAESTATPAEVYQANIEQFGYRSWYDFAAGEWGTKWDVGQEVQHERDGNTLNLSFDTAWSPPVPVFAKWVDLGFEVEAYYSEPGMCFVGSYTNEGGDDYLEYNASSLHNLRVSCPEVYIDMFGLDEWFDEEEAPE